MAKEAYAHPESNKKQRGNTNNPKGLAEKKMYQKLHDGKHDKRKQVSDHQKELLLKKLKARRKAAYLKEMEHKKQQVHGKKEENKQIAHKNGPQIMDVNHRQHNVQPTVGRKAEQAYQNQIHRMAAEHKKHAAYLKEGNQKQKDHREEEQQKKLGKHREEKLKEHRNFQEKPQDNRKYREENPKEQGKYRKEEHKKHKAPKNEEKHKNHRKEQDREKKAHNDRETDVQDYDEDQNMHWAEATTTAVRANERKNTPLLTGADTVKTVGVVTTSYFDGYGMAAGYTEDEFRGLGLIGIFEGENAASLGQSLVPNGLNLLVFLLLGLYWGFHTRHFS